MTVEKIYRNWTGGSPNGWTHDGFLCPLLLLDQPQHVKQLRLMLHSLVPYSITFSCYILRFRQFLWSFRLPGEAQKIDRMMESFAQRYCQLNPDIFNNSDTCYVLSFAIIMLNTSLHNPSVKDKPTVEQFISMNRGINDGGDLPKELLVVSWFFSMVVIKCPLFLIVFFFNFLMNSAHFFQCNSSIIR